MADELDAFNMDTLYKTLEDLAVRRESLHLQGKITEAEYNRLYVLMQDIMSMLRMGYRRTIHLTVETIEMEDRDG